MAEEPKKPWYAVLFEKVAKKPEARTAPTYEELVARCSALEGSLSDHRSTMRGLNEALHRVAVDRDHYRMVARNLREVLEFYADRRKWRANQLTDPRTAAAKDGGYRARQALK